MTIAETCFGLAISSAINFAFRIGTINTIKSKKPVLYAKKKTVDQSIIIRKNVMFSEIELKIAFEKNITITRPNVTLERTLLVMRT